jgi:hypothetical protein
MPPRMRRRGAVVTAAAIATLGLATAASGAVTSPYQVNNDPANGIDPAQNAGVSDVAGGSLTGGQRVPWATFEQKTGSSQQIFVRSFKDGVFTTRGNPASLNIDRAKEAEAPSIDFAGTGRTVPWVSWYEPNDNLPGGETNIFASRFDAAANQWIPEGQDRAPAHKVPSLNINTNREAENPSLVGGAAVAGNDPVPWVAWQEKDGASTNGASKNQIFVSRGIKGTTDPVHCVGNEPSANDSVAKFCWQQTGFKRLDSGQPTPKKDPTLNIDPTRNGIEPDMAFTGPQDTVPWVVWYEKDDSGMGLAGNEQVFAAKGIKDATAGLGGFHWQAVGNGTTNQTNVLDLSGTNKLGNCSESKAAEAQCTLNLDPAKDAEDPRVATGTLTPGGTTVPWVAWAETTASGHESIFVSRLVGDHFELANNGQPVSNPTVDAFKPDITFSGNTPYVSWQSGPSGQRHTVVGHFTSLTSFVVDTPPAFDPAVVDDVRSPVSSACTADPFTADGSACPAGDATPVFLRTTAEQPQRLLLNQIVPDHGGGPGPGGGGGPGKPPHHHRHHHKHWPQISGHALKLHADGSVRVKLTCPTAHGKRCEGTLKLTARHHTLGKRHFSLRKGHSARVKVHVNRYGQRLVHRAGHLKVKVSAGSSSRKVMLKA